MRIAEHKTLSSLYPKKHMWVRIQNNFVIVGVTDSLQKLLGAIVNVEFSGDSFVEKGCPVAWLESVKAVIAVLSPIDCEVVRVNERLIREPWLVNTSPYDEGWIASLKALNLEELKRLERARVCDDLI